jgi:hypothetical protein
MPLYVPARVERTEMRSLTGLGWRSSTLMETYCGLEIQSGLQTETLIYLEISSGLVKLIPTRLVISMCSRLEIDLPMAISIGLRSGKVTWTGLC